MVTRWLRKYGESWWMPGALSVLTVAAFVGHVIVLNGPAPISQVLFVVSLLALLGNVCASVYQFATVAWRKGLISLAALVGSSLVLLGVFHVLTVWMEFPGPSEGGSADEMVRTTSADLGSGPGLAARYPGDVGIEKDPAVVFVENFETGELEDIVARWGNGRTDNMILADEVSAVSSGKRSLRIAWYGHVYTHHRPVDQLFARYYVKFHEKCGYTHHLPFIIADGEPTPWPKGWGAKKPRGDDFFLTGLDAWGEWGTLQPPGKWMLYTYWQDMKPDAHGDYWGTNFKVAEQDPIERGRWICCEFMIKANSAPEKADGEQAFWIDGKLVGRFQGFRWRSTDDLKINSFWLNHDKDTHDLNNDADHPNRVYDLWFDDVVLATEYIGPVTPKQ